jgi:NADPH2:quinone reductase
MMSPGGSYAEYAVGWQHTTFHIPKQTSFEDAATLPLAAMTSAIGLHQRLGLPTPWSPAKEEIPLVVYGGASAVGGRFPSYTSSLSALVTRKSSQTPNNMY